jgi:hypothetical protein
VCQNRAIGGNPEEKERKGSVCLTPAGRLAEVQADAEADAMLIERSDQTV